MNQTQLNKRHALSVSELNAQARSLLESSFLQVRVQGELSNISRPSSGHWYFTLKDQKAQVRCAMFRNRNLHVRFSPKEGDQVILTAKVSLYEGRGDFQLIGEMLEADGEGQLQQAFEQLKAKLDAEGLFQLSQKKPIPKHPKHLGIITSPTGAAIHDVLTVLKRRFPGLKVTLYPSAVQGEDAPRQLLSALNLALKHDQADLIIIGRGGGSLEDLWPFNNEALARAIYHCPTPIISAVGHEVDFTIADLVADLRAPTPSAAAELISPDQEQLTLQLDRLQRRLEQLVCAAIEHRTTRLTHLRKQLRHPGERLKEQARQLNHSQQRLYQALQKHVIALKHHHEIAQQKLLRYHPQQLLEQKQKQAVRLDERLHGAIRKVTERQSQVLREKVVRLNAVNPLSTLERGYAIVSNAQQQVITDASDLKAGESVTTRLRHGSMTSRVETIQPEIYDV